MDDQCLFKWWRKHESMFPTIGFFVRQTLEIVGFQIEIEIIFSLVDIYTNLKKYNM